MQIDRDAVQQKYRDLQRLALEKVHMKPEDLEKLSKVPLLVGFVGIFVNVLLLSAINNFAWLEGTAMYEGQPFTAHLSLMSVQFGVPADPARDNKYICPGSDSNYCKLSDLCHAEGNDNAYPNGLRKYTSPATWCAVSAAGGSALGLLWIAFLPGLAASGLTLLYAGKDIRVVGELFDKAESMGINLRIQRLVLAGCWGVLWVFMFFSMTVYASFVPDTLGWGGIKLESSFGLLRFSFILISMCGSLLVASLFELWHSENVEEAWLEFLETKWLTAKKALYVELMAQFFLYLLLTVSEVDWSVVLTLLAGYYLDTKNKNFMLLYITLVTISLLFDTIKAANLPSFDNMAPGDSFGATVWIFIFLLKFGILVTIYLYEKEGDSSPDAWHRMHAKPDTRDDEIAE